MSNKWIYVKFNDKLFTVIITKIETRSIIPKLEFQIGYWVLCLIAYQTGCVLAMSVPTMFILA